jgi:transcription initiation factor TFIID TATA-box-binding protein
MEATRRVINLMREMKVNQRIPLEEIFQLYHDESTLHRGRPEMLVMRMSINGRNLQLFRGGKIQILGAVPSREAEAMRHEIATRLRRLPTMEKCQVTPLTITNLVASLQLPSTVNLQKISHSNHDMTYEAELFPAALIRKWHPAHVALFHNGKIIVTGIKTLTTLNDIFHHTQEFLSHHQLQ